jgi:hypothetical protein
MNETCMMANDVGAPFIVGGLTMMFLPTMIVLNKSFVFDGARVAVSRWKCWMRQRPQWKRWIGKKDLSGLKSADIC